MTEINLSEHEEAILLVDYLDILVSQKKIIKYTHVNGEVYTPYWGQQRKKKRIGGYKGFPDYIILTNKELIFLELKKSKNGVTSLEQKDWIDGLKKVGYHAYVAEGFNKAKKIIDALL